MREKEEQSEEDAVLEMDTTAIENDASTFAKKLEKAKKALKECEALKKEYLDGWQREKADAQNQKKLHLQRLAEEQNKAIAVYALAILPMVDSIYAAKNQYEDNREVQDGLNQIYAQCIQSLKNLTITILDTPGEAFDPQAHEAVGKKPVDAKDKDGMIVEILRIGAKIDTLVIRPAMVCVGEYKS